MQKNGDDNKLDAAVLDDYLNTGMMSEGDDHWLAARDPLTFSRNHAGTTLNTGFGAIKINCRFKAGNAHIL